MKNFFKVLGIIFILLIVSGVYLCLVNRIRGEIKVTINGEVYHINEMNCNYISNQQIKEKIKYDMKNHKMYFGNRGIRYGKYVYSFYVQTDDLNICPEFIYFKTDKWKCEELKLRLDILGEGNEWNAIMIMEDKEGYCVEKQVDLSETDDLIVQMGP